jgi:hypothetical protein
LPNQEDITRADRQTTVRLSGSAVSFGLSSFFLGCRPFPIRAQAKAPHPLKQDESCLACHGQAGMKSDSGKSISIDPAKHMRPASTALLGCTDCHTTIKEYPHPAKKSRIVQCATCHADEASHVPASIHGAVGVSCQSCHGDPHEVLLRPRWRRQSARNAMPTK